MADASRVALVTGASRGIGREIALALAKQDIAVGLLARDADALEGVRRDCAQAGARVAVARADVTDHEQVEEAVAAVRSELGPIDLLVNNAGRIESTEVPIWRADPDEWWAVVETDLRGPFLCCRTVLPDMVERRRGRIVNISTGMAFTDADVYSAYRVAKTGLVRLTGAVAAAGAPYGVTAFDVAPGVVPTDMTRSMEMHTGRTEWTPPKLVCDLVTAIASGRADALSGRYLRAGADDLDTLLATAERIVEQDARTLRLRPYGSDDPLA